jgi:hypothetical protein
MSYPYTKSQPRFGFRRRWGDPHVGIVGSGPGRPLRRYSTDAEVGLPQLGPGLTALGASPETPVDDGIFNVGPAQGFSRGVFTPDPPWATPRYIAATPDGVSGLGAFGAVSDPCGIEAAKKWLVTQIYGNLKRNPVTGSLIKIAESNPFASIDVRSTIKLGLDAAGNAAMDKLLKEAELGAPKATAYFAANISPKIAAKISGVVKALSTNQVNTALKAAFAAQASNLVSWLKSCAGAPAKSAALDPTKIYSGPQPCNAIPGYKAQALKPGEFGYPGYKCVKKTEASMAILAEVLELQKTAQMDPTKSAEAAEALMRASVTTLSAEKAKCAAAGGEWYPGGADCLVDSSGTLYNCQAPTASTYKKYYCVPKGTTGAQAVTATGEVKKTNLPLILGAAAVAALVLTRMM